MIQDESGPRDGVSVNEYRPWEAEGATEVEYWQGRYLAMSKAQGEAESALQRAEAELEVGRMRLAACGVAAMQNTHKTVGDRIARDNPYWSASYGDVCAAVDREIQERERAEKAEHYGKTRDADQIRTAAALEWAEARIAELEIANARIFSDAGRLTEERDAAAAENERLRADAEALK